MAEDADAYALSSQTRACAWLAASGITARSGKQPMVALQTDDSEIWDQPFQARSYTLLVRPPRPDASFVERWLNADVLVATMGSGTLTHPEFAGAAPAKIAAFRDLVLAHLRQLVVQGRDADLRLCAA